MIKYTVKKQSYILNNINFNSRKIRGKWYAKKTKCCNNTRMKCLKNSKLGKENRRVWKF